MLKGIDKFFDGPIKINGPPQPFNPIGWVDVVNFAKSTPNDFILVTQSDGSRCCQFICRGLQVEITEDDWRIISSGALDRFPTEHPFEEDEVAELATLDILEQRANALYKKADEVAARARILHHRLGQRKQDLTRRRNATSGHRYGANADQRRSQGPGMQYDLHTDLLQQFLATSAVRRVGTGLVSGTPNLVPISPTAHSPLPGHRLSIQSGRSSTSHPAELPGPIDHRAEFIRSLVTQKVEKQARGDSINPPCDRCRRLKLQCTKNLTACQGCTKKHAKCSWKSVTEDEATVLKREMGLSLDVDSEKGDGRTERKESGDSSAIRSTIESARGASVMEDFSRPQSRAGTDASRSMVYSPDLLSSARSDHSVDLGRSAALPALTGPAPAIRRDGPRLSQIPPMAPGPEFYRSGPHLPSPSAFPPPPRLGASPYGGSTHYSSPHGSSPQIGTPQSATPQGSSASEYSRPGENAYPGHGPRGPPQPPHGPGYRGQ